MGYAQICKLSRRVVNKQKEKVILDYMRNNWDVVLNSSVSMMKTLPLKTRFRFAIDILFANRKKAFKAIRGGEKSMSLRKGIQSDGNISKVC
ncbi:MAG: hypothetical protein LBK25_08185 [Treponema sp.]|jgi:hypothetical protein|nr:hypothetical protein [Treponema sp.]